MDADLIAELAAQAPITVLLVTYDLPDQTVRWTDGGFVVWDDELYEARTSFGVISEVGEISDGVDGEATSCAITLMPADNDSFSAMIAPEVQGSVVTIHLGAVDFQTGLLVGEPDLLLRCEVDVPRLTGSAGALVHDTITEETRMLEVNDERRLTHPFHTDVWPDEDGYKNVTGLKVKIYWRASDPNNAIS